MTISDQVYRYIEQEFANGASYDDLCGTLFIRPDGTTLRIRRAKLAKARNSNRFDSSIVFGEKLVILPLPKEAEV